MPSNAIRKGEGSTLQEPDTIMSSAVQHLQGVLQSTGSSPLAEGQQRGELMAAAKTLVSIWSIFNCMEELAMLFLEGRKRYGKAGTDTLKSGKPLEAKDILSFIIPSTDTGGAAAFVWIHWCQDITGL